MLPEAEGSIFNPRSQFFIIRTDPKPVNKLFIFFLSLKRRKTHASVTVTVVRHRKIRIAKRSEKKINVRSFFFPRFACAVIYRIPAQLIQLS